MMRTNAIVPIVMLLWLALTVRAQTAPTQTPSAQTAPAQTPPAKSGFADVTRESGVYDVALEQYKLMAPMLAKSENKDWWVSGYTLVDLDGDGDLDLHMAGHGQFAAAAWNDGKGHFTRVDGKFDIPRGPKKTQDIPYPGGELRMIYDLDEDGKLDILASYGDNAGAGYLNASASGKTPADEPSLNFKPYDPGFDPFSRAVAFVDINRDGIVDCMYAGDDGRAAKFSKLHVYFGKGGGKWEAGPKLDVLKEAGGVPVDLDGDGMLDLLVSQRGYNPVKRWILMNDPKTAATNPASGGLSFTPATDNGLGEDGAILGYGDVDQDGDVDLICIDSAAGGKNLTPALYLNDGKGKFTRKDLPPLRRPGYGTWGGAVVTDFDNDGVADIVAFGRNFLYYLRGNGGGAFESANAAWGIPDAIGVHVEGGLCFGDIDGDGDLDVVTEGNPPEPYKSDGVRVFRNDLPGKHWVRVRPVGKEGNQAAAGSTIRLTDPATGKLLWHEQVGVWGRQNFHSYYFQTQTERHFGLGDREKVDVTVEFYPSGKNVQKKDVPANSTVAIAEE